MWAGYGAQTQAHVVVARAGLYLQTISPLKNTLIPRQEARLGPRLLLSTADPRTQGLTSLECRLVSRGKESVGRKD